MLVFAEGKIKSYSIQRTRIYDSLLNNNMNFKTAPLFACICLKIQLNDRQDLQENAERERKRNCNIKKAAK
jgi:hypothetical protein